MTYMCNVNGVKFVTKKEHEALIRAFPAMLFQTTQCSPKLYSWVLRLKELSMHGKWQELLFDFQEVITTGVKPLEPSVFSYVLKACSNLSFSHGKSVHGYLTKTGFDSCTSLGNSSMDFYMKCKCLDDALSVFSSMKSRDSVSWNIMVHGILVQGCLRQGLWWFKRARLSGFQPNISTLVLVLQACRGLGTKPQALALHGYIIRSGFWTISSIQNSLLNIYAEDDMDSAQKVFDEMTERDVISWSVMISGFVYYLKAQVSIQMFMKMVFEVGIVPDGITVVSALKACASLGDIIIGTLVHGMVICRGLDSDLFVRNSLIDMYSKSYDANSAFRVFKEIPQRNSVSWNSIISGFVLNEKHLEALSLFNSMRKDGIEADEVSLVNILKTCKHFGDPLQCKSVHCVTIRREHESNEMVLNTLIDAYAKCSLIEIARGLFDGMKTKDVVSWSTMIAGLTHCGRPDEAILLFLEMGQARVKPNWITIINVLEACSVLSELKRAKWAHALAIRRGLATEAEVGTAVVDMYSKCGVIEASKRAFNQISEKNIVSWSAMISAYGMNGLAREALTSFAEMKSHGLKPNAVTNLCVLSACGHGGLIKEGLFFFNSMVQDHGLEVGLEHYSCVVDMLGRAGQLNAAQDFISRMPEGLKPGTNAWSALLSACRSYRNCKLGAEAASHVLELEPWNSTGYLLASSIYATEGLWVNAANMRTLIKERAVEVVAGYSLVHVGNKVHRFVAGDTSHLQAENLYLMIKLLHSIMKMEKRDDLYIADQ